MDTNVIYCDDNLHRLALLPSESVDLIYLDPPFFSNHHYEVIWGDEAEVRSFEDRWDGGINHYVGWMRDRVIEMRRVLKPTGSLYLHCDWHASHYLKVMLDDVFGYDHFLNEIVWHYNTGGKGARTFLRKHDTIFWYAKQKDDYLFNRDAIALDRQVGTAHLRHGTDEDGREYYEDFSPRKSGKQYRWYLDHGLTPMDVWTDIQALNPAAKERWGYPTQKPESLLERIIKASSNAGDLILDPFSGCGTALSVAHQLGRRWIGVDISPTACSLMNRRLAKIGASDYKLVGMPISVSDLKGLKPFEFQNWIIDRISGIQANRKSGDMGIDGWTFMLHDPVQIKQSESIGRNVVDNFETAMKRAKKDKGVIFGFSFGRGAHEEVARVKGEHVDIQLHTVGDLLNRPDYVLGQMGINFGFAGMAVAPMPVFDAKRHSAQELVTSQAH